MGEVLRKVVRRPVPVKTRKTVIRKVILTPNGQEKKVEERVEHGNEEERMVVPTLVHEDESVPLMFQHGVTDDDENQTRKVITVRRRIIRKIIVMPDGTRKEVEEEVPVDENNYEPTEQMEESVTDDDGTVRKVITVRRRIIKKIIVMPDGTRKEVEEEVPVEEDDYDVIEKDVAPTESVTDDDGNVRKVITVRRR